MYVRFKNVTIAPKSQLPKRANVVGSGARDFDSKETCTGISERFAFMMVLEASVGFTKVTLAEALGIKYRPLKTIMTSIKYNLLTSMLY